MPFLILKGFNLLYDTSFDDVLILRLLVQVGLAKILSRENTQVSMQSTFDWAAPEVHPYP